MRLQNECFNLKEDVYTNKICKNAHRKDIHRMNGRYIQTHKKFHILAILFVYSVVDSNVYIVAKSSVLVVLKEF